MKIEGEFVFTARRTEVWAALTDPDVLVASIPGVRQLEASGTDTYLIVVKAGVGTVRGTYEGTFGFSDQQPPEGCTVRAALSGAPGSVETVARMLLTDADGSGTLLRYDAETSVTGPLAGVGQRLLGAAAKRTTEQFLQAVESQMHEPEASTPRASAREPSAAHERGARGPSPDPKLLLASAVGGFLLALVAVAVGRWTGRR